MFETLFGVETPLVVRFFFAFLIMLGLFGGAAWAVRRIVTGRSGRDSSRGRQLRLAVVDSASVDGRRRLILIRRDNIEHLVMIGGPTDLAVEPNIVRAVAAPHEVAASPTATEPLPRFIQNKRSWPLQPEPARRPRPAPQTEPLPEEPAAWSLQSHGETSTRAQRDTLAALADELSTYSVPLRSSPPRSARARPAGSRMPTGQLPSGESASADPNLAELAGHLEAAVRRPAAPAEERGARPGSHAVERALAVETAPPPRAAPMAAEPQPTHAEANASHPATLYDSDSLARGMARLLGRPTFKV